MLGQDVCKVSRRYVRVMLSNGKGRSWELAPFDVCTGMRRERRETKTKFRTNVSEMDQ